jgi:hypothetical protein
MVSNYTQCGMKQDALEVACQHGRENIAKFLYSKLRMSPSAKYYNVRVAQSKSVETVILQLTCRLIGCAHPVQRTGETGAKS